MILERELDAMEAALYRALKEDAARKKAESEKADGNK